MLEWALLRRSLTVMSAGRSRCHDCGRTPLTGESVYFYEPRTKLVCELCRPLRRARPDREDIVHSSEHGLTVRSLRAGG